VAWQVQSDIALGMVCGMSRFSLVVMTSRAAAAHGWSRRRVQSHIVKRCGLGMFSCRQLAAADAVGR